MENLGTLYGISVGTGDSELITVKGLKILQNTTWIAFPQGINHQLGFAQRIITPWLTDKQELLPLSFPYTQDEVLLKKAWKIAAKTVWTYLEKGEDIAFVCEGDVNFYSTFTYLAQTLSSQHPEVNIQTIPGVCSPMAVASMVGIPLTLKEQSLAILPALYSLEDLEKALDWAEVVVLMKVASVYSQVWEILQRRNLLHHAIIVEKATLPEQKIYWDLQPFPDLKLSYFSLLLITVNRES